jgi:hypothetical protein
MLSIIYFTETIIGTNDITVFYKGINKFKKGYYSRTHREIRQRFPKYAEQMKEPFLSVIECTCW